MTQDDALSLERFDRPLLMLGCGNMAGAMLARWLECGLSPGLVTIVDPGRQQAPQDTALMAALPETLPAGSVVVLGIKPQMLGEVAPLLAPLLPTDAIVISMLAGITLAGLRDALGEGADIIRIMPNTPVALGKGVCAYCTEPGTGATARTITESLLAPLGLVERLADEGQMNLVTALSGSGPAFVYRFIDALGAAAAELGLAADMAARLALATVEGATALACTAQESPAQLAERVASPGGTTRAGLNVLDEDAALRSLLLATLRAARDRGEEMAKLAG